MLLRAARPSRLPRAVAPVAAAVLALGLTGCSGAEEDPEDEPAADDVSSESAAPEEVDASVLQEAVDATIAARAFTIDGDLDLEIGGQTLELGTAGSVDYDTTVADILISVAQGGQSTEAEVKADGTTLWVRAEGPATPPYPEGTSWAQGEASRLTESTTFEPAGLLGAVLVLRGASEVSAVGTEEEDGVEVTRYQTTFTYDDALAGVQGEEAQVLGSAFSLTGAASSIDLDVEVGVGEDGVIRDFDLEVAETDVPASGGYEITLSDVGGDVAAPKPPPADEVATGEAAAALLDQIVS